MQASKKAPKKVSWADKPEPGPTMATRLPEYQSRKVNGPPEYESRRVTMLPTYSEAIGSTSKEPLDDGRPIFYNHRPIPGNTFERILVDHPEAFGYEPPPKRKKKRLRKAVGKVVGIAVGMAKEMMKTKEVVR